MFKRFRKPSAKTSFAKEVTNPSTKKVYTISGVRRFERVPEVDGKPFNMEYDIAIFEGSFMRNPALGYSLPLCKFIVEIGTGLSLQEVCARLETPLSEGKKFSSAALIKSITNPGLNHWSTEYNDMYHDFQTLPVHYIW